jgi:hypothetical protein
MSQQHHELPMLGAIAGVIRWVEELVSLIAGPVLTIGLAIALIDLLTDGGLLRSQPDLLYAYAVSQAVGIDAQLVSSWDRVKLAIGRRAWGQMIGWTLLGLALGYIGFLSAQAFGFSQAFGLSEPDALARLGIDGASWQLQRALLAVFLVALSGFTRYHAPPKAKQTLEDERAQLARELELEPLRQRLRAQRTPGVATLARQAIGGALGRDVRAPDRPPTGPGSPTVAPGSALPVRTPSQPRRQEVIRLIDPDAPKRRRVAASGRANGPRTKSVRTPRDSDAAERAARAAWRPGMSVGELQAAARISRNAASKHRRILIAEAEAGGKAM